MNKWVYNIGILLLSVPMLFLSACSDEVIPPDQGGSGTGTGIIGQGEKDIPLVISLKDLSGVSTYSTINYPGDKIGRAHV